MKSSRFCRRYRFQQGNGVVVHTLAGPVAELAISGPQLSKKLAWLIERSLPAHMAARTCGQIDRARAEDFLDV